MGNAMIKLLSVKYDHLEQTLDKRDDFKVHVYHFGKKDRRNPKKGTELVKLAGQIKPHIFWIWKHEFITPKILRGIKQVSPKTKVVMWYGDLRGNTIVPLIRERRPFLSGLFITNNAPRQIQMYKQFGIPHVSTFYHSFSTDEFQLWDRPITHDVFFGGTNFSVKKFPLSALRRQFIYTVHKNFNLVVHGGGWKFPTAKWILRPVYAKELRKAHINLGMNHYHVTRYYNRRLFECVASGRLHITYYIPGMEQHFENKKHLVWFTTVDQGIKLIKYYLNNPEEREQIAKQGREFFIENHSWPVRTKQFVKKINNIL
jgi:hypothetical protein